MTRVATSKAAFSASSIRAIFNFAENWTGTRRPSSESTPPLYLEYGETVDLRACLLIRDVHWERPWLVAVILVAVAAVAASQSDALAHCQCFARRARCGRLNRVAARLAAETCIHEECADVSVDVRSRETLMTPFSRPVRKTAGHRSTRYVITAWNVRKWKAKLN